MINESKLKIGGKYLYWSPPRICHVRVVYDGKRNEPGTNEQIFVFRESVSLNEIWTHNLFNIVIDDGWLEKFVNTPEDEEIT